MIEDGNSKSNAEVLEERDPSYEAMLSQMVGKINTKPGGKLEMGEVRVYYLFRSSFQACYCLYLLKIFTVQPVK